MNDRRYWFKRRRLGLGWAPQTWEGWAATAGFVALSGALAKKRGVRYALLAAFVALAAITGEPLW
ncbi:MAG TPA: hypothetical protein VGX91_09890 [Candidatus Cybelea sp.]|jgi:hypothetical protein|nr:hypothetical protein [Candidatus Cybelea sp.]